LTDDISPEQAKQIDHLSTNVKDNGTGSKVAWTDKISPEIVKQIDFANSYLHRAAEFG